MLRCTAAFLVLLQATSTAAQGAAFVAAGCEYTCAIRKDGATSGSLVCFGQSNTGQLGYNNNDLIGDDENPAAFTVNLGPGRTAKAVAVGGQSYVYTRKDGSEEGATSGHSCVLLDNNQVTCFGANAYGQLGLGDTLNRGESAVPGFNGLTVNLGAGRSAKAIDSGHTHMCAVLDNGSLLCWGNNEYGQLGIDTTENVGDDETPEVAGKVDLGAHTVKMLAVGYEHTCVILNDDTTRCWGAGSRGTLGYGTSDDVDSALNAGTVDVGVGLHAVSIHAGREATCAILNNGKLLCWGSNESGMLGYPAHEYVGDDETPGSHAYVNLGEGVTAKTVSINDAKMCVLLNNNTVKCYGYSEEGALGYGDVPYYDSEIAYQEPKDLPAVDIGAGHTAKFLSTGMAHVCVIRDDDALLCWGRNGYGELGLGNTDSVGDDETPGSVNKTVKLGGTAYVAPTASPTPAPGAPSVSVKGSLTLQGQASGNINKGLQIAITKTIAQLADVETSRVTIVNMSNVSTARRQLAVSAAVSVEYTISGFAAGAAGTAAAQTAGAAVAGTAPAALLSALQDTAAALNAADATLGIDASGITGATAGEATVQQNTAAPTAAPTEAKVTSGAGSATGSAVAALLHAGACLAAVVAIAL